MTSCWQAGTGPVSDAIFFTFLLTLVFVARVREQEPVSQWEGRPKNELQSTKRDRRDSDAGQCGCVRR